MNTQYKFLAAACGLVTILFAIPGFAAEPMGDPQPPPPSTISDDLKRMDVVVLVKLVHIVRQYEELPEATGRFEITDVLKGNNFVKVGLKLELNYRAVGKIGDFYWLNGTSAKQMQWSIPELVSGRAVGYMQKLATLPKNNAQRLPFFLAYLDDEDKLVAQDSLESFTPANYAEVQALKPHLKHDQIVASIQNAKTPAGHRRLFLKLLGVCGDEKDLAWLEEDMRATDRDGHAPLDAVIGCYLTLSGESGLALVEELFLRNPKADYRATLAAILALRFHVNEATVLKRERVVQTMRLMLKRPELADLVLPDLAAWKDWTVSEEVFELFKTADPRSTWVRVPAYNYLRLCPTERAREMMAECEQIDPAAVKRAKTFFPDAR